MNKKSKSNFEQQTIRIFWNIILKNKKLFLLSLIYFVGVIGVGVMVPFLVSSTLANLATGHTDVTQNLLWLGGVALVGVLGNLIGFTSLIRLQAKCSYDVLELAMTTLLKRSTGFHANNIGGKLVNNALEYPQAFNRLLDSIYISIIPFFLVMVVGISIVLSHSIEMGLALIAIVVITVGMIIIESMRRSGLRVDRKKAQNKVIAHLSDTVININAAKTFARERDELNTHRSLSTNLLNLRLKDWSSTARSGSLRMGILLGMQVIFIAYVAHLIRQDPSILAIGIFSFTYTISLTSKLFEVGTMIRNIEESFLQSASMTEILLQDSEIIDAKDAKSLDVKEAVIDLKDVTFAYQDSSQHEEVFSNLNLRIPAGQRIGLVGPSGGGKSTLTRLLLRFDDINEGTVAIDGQNIHDVTQASLRQSISYVPQEPLLFHRTIIENIAYGKPDATEKEVRAAAKLAYADEFIQKLPQKYETIVGERGVKLSGGQRQRVAIARAILKDAPILILDEATSALDSESEVYIQKALAELMKGRTTLVIAHRLSTIQKLDRIIVLNDGIIEEDGSHTKLIENKKLYAKLWAHQSGGFIEE
ncbi:MAG TPA: ABC transporter ATP-binding protein [Candidatus Saccharimonadales bacterium]|nr:ABC transporter ATP-binding protein [Candidatus Saccharimonadales bacterium]